MTLNRCFSPAQGDRVRAPMSKFPLYSLPVVVWAALMGFFSTDTFHGRLTQGIVRSVLLFFLPDLSQEMVGLVHTVVRKLAHMTEYCIFTLLLYREFRPDAPNVRHWRWGVASAFGGDGIFRGG